MCIPIIICCFGYVTCKAFVDPQGEDLDLDPVPYPN